jgi:REP element-mobilizing transposase RayT
MARPLRIEYSGAFYHITSRGNERKEVFKSQRDREKFLFYRGSTTERYGAIIHVYCLWVFFLAILASNQRFP